jgi:hypothetical protein
MDEGLAPLDAASRKLVTETVFRRARSLLMIEHGVDLR